MTKIDEVAKAIGAYSVHRYWRLDEPGQFAIHHRVNGEVATMDSEAEAHDKCARLNARAAIEALREPTPEMLNVGTEARWKSCVRDENSVCEIWQAMIDTLLKAE